MASVPFLPESVSDRLDPLMTAMAFLLDCPLWTHLGRSAVRRVRWLRSKLALHRWEKIVSWESGRNPFGAMDFRNCRPTEIGVATWRPLALRLPRKRGRTMAHLARVALFAFAMLLHGIARAGEPFVPSWIRNDTASKTVSIEIVADWGVVARYAKGDVRTDVIDFNGYWGGNLTISVPTGWSVRITFVNHSGVVRHGLMVTRPYAQSEMPVRLRAEDAVWGAYVVPLEGIFPQETAQLDFVARQVGSYLLACSRENHLMWGHWIGLDVKDGLEQAVAVVHEDRFPPSTMARTYGA